MSRKPRTTPHLFSEWDHVADRIREKKRLAVFLDFDGTLVRIAPMPTSVRLDEETRNILKKLSGNRNVTLAIISGRQRAELQRYIGIRNMKYLGLYGWEKKENQRVSFPVREALARTLVTLLAELHSYPGVWIEPKRNSFSVHLLGASPKTQREMREQVQKRVQPMRETLQVMANIRDLEVAPLALGNKGMAVKKLLDDPALREALPVYFGDDFSDEPAFAAAHKGISVLVGRRRATKAQFCLRGPAEVATALARMEEIIR
jgi:trehalose 6-phosphate phosphatase